MIRSEVARRPEGRLESVRNLDLAEYAVQVSLHGAGAYEEPFGDVVVAGAYAQQRQDLGLQQLTAGAGVPWLGLQLPLRSRSPC